MEKLNKITVRARVAYSLICLENFIRAAREPLKDWNLILDKLWSFTSTKQVDDWLYMLAEYIPRTIVECKFDQDDVEYLTYHEFDILSKLYIRNNSINNLINLIFDLGTVDIYGDIKIKDESIEVLSEIIKIVDLNNINRPKINFDYKFQMRDDNQWGDSFTKADFLYLLES